MLISRTSRYQRNQTALVADRHGDPQLCVVRLAPVDQVLQVSDYRWQQVDRVDHLAAEYYGSESSWWMFAEANPQVLDWLAVPPGTRVRVPRVA